MIEYILVVLLGLVIFWFFFSERRNSVSPKESVRKPLISLSISEPLSDLEIDGLVNLAQTCNLLLIVDVAVDSVSLKPLREVLKHKLLLSEKTEGRVSLVRQLQPRLHLDTDASVVERLVGKVPEVAKIRDTSEALDVLRFDIRFCGCVGY
jgi:hypothetical protein